MPDAPSPLVPLRFRLPYANELEFLEKFSANLARGGFFLPTKSTKPEGTRVAFEFVVADNTCVLRGEGLVAKVLAEAPGTRAGMTVRFTQLDQKSRNVVDRALALKQGVPEAPLPAAVKEVVEPPGEAEKRRRREQILSAPTPGAAVSGKEPVIGIDLGTTNCRAAVVVDGQVKLLPLEGKSTALPSVVAFDGHGRMMLGSRAKAHLLVDPLAAIYGSKRLLGRRARSMRARQMAGHFPYKLVADDDGDVAVEIRDRLLRIPEISGFLLKEIASRASEALGRPVKRAVLGVPAYFNDRQRQALREAGSLAGLVVERIMSEPTAVALAFGYGRGLARKRLLVYDLGGGTFDASVLDATGDDYDVVAAGGDNFLGGIDFDAKVLDDLLGRFSAQSAGVVVEDVVMKQRVRDAAETAKISLSEKTEARVRVPWAGAKDGKPVDLDLPLERKHFEALTQGLVQRTVEVTQAVLGARQITPSQIDEVILVGGQSQSPSVRKAVETLMGRPARGEVDPHDAVAIGAALLGRAIRDEDEAFITIRLNEALSVPVGLGTQGGKFVRVLDRNTRLPCEKSYALPAAAGYPVRMAVYQGDSERADDNEYLGALTVEAQARGEISLRFSMSRDGVLSLSARTADGQNAAVSFATKDAPDEVRARLLDEAPLPGDEPDENKGLLKGLKRLFGGK